MTWRARRLAPRPPPSPNTAAGTASCPRSRRWPNGLPEPKHPPTTGCPTCRPDTRIAEPVRLAKLHWRIEHHYRELKHGLGLDHFEGRSRIGWHHHVTLVTAAQAFLTAQRLAPMGDAPTSPSTRSSTPSKT